MAPLLSAAGWLASDRLEPLYEGLAAARGSSSAWISSRRIRLFATACVASLSHDWEAAPRRVAEGVVRLVVSSEGAHQDSFMRERGRLSRSLQKVACDEQAGGVCGRCLLLECVRVVPDLEAVVAWMAGVSPDAAPLADLFRCLIPWPALLPLGLLGLPAGSLAADLVRGAALAMTPLAPRSCPPMAALADALEAYHPRHPPSVAAHLRSRNHSRGCWALDALSGRLASLEDL